LVGWWFGWNNYVTLGELDCHNFSGSWGSTGAGDEEKEARERERERKEEEKRKKKRGG